MFEVVFFFEINDRFVNGLRWLVKDLGDDGGEGDDDVEDGGDDDGGIVVGGFLFFFIVSIYLVLGFELFCV